MTPLEQIKHGILTGNMQSVADGYSRITNDVVTPKAVSKTPKLAVDRRRLPQRQQQQTPVFDEAEFQVDQQTTAKKMDKEARVEPFVPKRRVNLFSDAKDEPLVDYTEKDRQDDIRTRQAPKVQRRPEYKPVKINCFSCGRSYNVNPAFIVGGGYRCDRCSSGK